MPRSIAEQLRAQADVEVERIKVQGAQQVQLLRAQLIRQLRQDLGAESVRRAGDLVREHVSDPACASRRPSTVSSTNSTRWRRRASPPRCPRQLRSASREALAAVVGRFDAVATDLSGESDFDACRTSWPRWPSLLDARTDPGQAPGGGNRSRREAKKRMLQRLLGGKIGDPAMDDSQDRGVGALVVDSDLVDVVEHVARLSPVGARRARQPGRRGRGAAVPVRPHPRRASRGLTTLLSDYTAPAGGPGRHAAQAARRRQRCQRDG